MKALIALDDGAGPASAVLDHEFIVAHTNGFDAFAADLRAAEWSPLEAASGLSRDALESVAAAYAKSNATIVSYGMGITQHTFGVHNVQAIVNLALSQGWLGKEHCGVVPIRGRLR